MEERQTNYTIAEGFTLPSRGLIYDKKVEPQVELRSMTAKEEMQRLSSSTTPLKIMANIIEACLVEKPAIHVYDLCVGDFEFLIQKLRIVTYDKMYKMEVRCPYCGQVIDTEIDLDQLVEKEFNIEEFEQLRNITLPRSNHLVSLNFQTPRMIEENQLKAKDMKRKYKGADKNFELLITLTSAIDTVDGKKMNQFELENFINNLPAIDMTKILNTLDSLNEYVGLDNTIYITCDKCKEEIRTFFRFDDEFFRPTNI